MHGFFEIFMVVEIFALFTLDIVRGGIENV